MDPFSRAANKLEYTNILNLEDEEAYNIPILETPSTIINALTGIGGLPKGKIVEIYGPYSSGKTTFALQLIGKIQKDNSESRVLFIDLEQTFDANYAKKLNVSMLNSRTNVIQPAFGEDAAKLVLYSIQKNIHDLIVIDSLTTMNTKDYLTGKSNALGSRARLVTEFLNKVLAFMIESERKPCILLISQMRTKIDLQNAYNTRQSSASNNAIDHYVVMKILLRQQEAINTGEKFDNKKQLSRRFNQYRIKVKIEKNKYGGEKDIEGSFVLEKGSGINDDFSIIEMAIDRYVKTSGAWMKYEGLTQETSLENIHGREAMNIAILNNSLIYDEVKARILDEIKEAKPLIEDSKGEDFFANIYDVDETDLQSHLHEEEVPFLEDQNGG